MKQILNFPAESAFRKPNRGQDALAPGFRLKRAFPLDKGVPPSIGAQRRAAMREDVCGTDACFLRGSA